LQDNFYAREISLHDFHFLHTSANIAGSLRLRLYISGPRFSVRYHALQGLFNLHSDDSRDLGHGEIGGFRPLFFLTFEPTLLSEKPLDEHEDRELCVQEDVSVAENASTSDDRRLGPSRGIQDQLLEGGPERVDGYHEASHTVSEGTATEPGEIDLSTLPPFIDSPEAHEENAEQQGEYSNEVLYPTTTTPDNASTGDNYTQDDEQRSEEQEIEEQGNDEQENEEQGNEERENHEEQESNQSGRKEESGSTRIKSAAVVQVDKAQDEENGPFEENVADGFKTPNIIEGVENRGMSSGSIKPLTC
jgi:hypothetical protein